MPEIDRYRPEDQRGVEALYRRVFGPDAAAASRLRWDWQYRRNPNNPDGAPLLWVVREGPTIIGHYATMPVRLSLGGKEIQAAWGTDAMVAPERQRRGLGEELFRTWDRSVGAALGLGLSSASSRAAEEDALPRRAADSGPRQAADAPRRPHAAVADGAQSLRLGRHAADRARRRARAAAARRRRADPPLRCIVHRSVGAARRSIRARGSPRRGVPELEVHRAAARAVLGRRAQARRARRRLCGVSPRAGAARPRHAARRFPRRHARRDRVQDAAALGRRRSARGRLGQDPLLRVAPRVPPHHAALRIFSDEAESADAGGEDQCRDRAREVLQGHRRLAHHAR